jgi:hypothetical protein
LRKPVAKSHGLAIRLCNGFRTSGLGFSPFGHIKSAIALGNDL